MINNLKRIKEEKSSNSIFENGDSKKSNYVNDDSRNNE